MRIPSNFRFILLLLAFLLLTGCSTAKEQTDDRLSVVATTTIVGDVVSVVGGDLISLNILLPVDADPHSYQPVPQDLAAISKADVVFLNGLGLEEFLEEVVAGAVEGAEMVSVSEGVVTLDVGEEEEEEEEEHEHGDEDPHVWMDPNNVIVWVENIAAKLSELDPANAEVYAANAEAYIQELEALDAWIMEQATTLPVEDRLLVADHDTLAYFAARYGFELVGAVIPGFSTLAEPSAQDIAKLQDQILALGVKAVFVGATVNPNLVERVAEDTGAQVITLYTGSLSGPDGPAPTYLEMMRYNVRAIVEALE